MRRTAGAAALTALVVPLTACHTVPKAGGQAAEPTNVSIMVGGLDKVIYLPAELTDRLGYFKEQGLTVDLQSQRPAGGRPAGRRRGRLLRPHH